MSFQTGVITNQGNDLKAKTDAGAALVFTRLVMGDGVAAQGTDPMTLTALVSEKKAFDISSYLFLGSGRTRIRTNLSNAGLVTGFFAREVGLMANDPDVGEILYSYASADPADWIPPETEAFQQIFDLFALTGSTSNITVTLAPNVATLVLADMQDHEAKQLDPASTNAVREKHLSDQQANKWETHVNASAPHAGHETPAGAQAKVDAAINTLINASPATLDTLDELAAALGDDPNFATTITNLIATKLNASAYTAADVLAKLLTVHGHGSNLDACKLDGKEASEFSLVHSHPYTDGKVTQKSTRTTTGTWTITGLTIGKPLIIGMRAAGTSGNSTIYINSGANIGRTGGGYFSFRTGGVGDGDPAGFVTVPTATTVSISVVGVSANTYLYAYQ